MGEGTQGWRLRLRAVIALVCLLVALGFGASDHRAAFADLNHQLHGDAATSDGGWVIADCATEHAPCADDGLDGDGHHHHAADHGSAYAAPLTADVTAPLHLPVALGAHGPGVPLGDADLSRQGPVPRVPHRLI